MTLVWLCNLTTNTSVSLSQIDTKVTQQIHIFYLMYTKIIIRSFYIETLKYSRHHLNFFYIYFRENVILFWLSKVHFNLDSLIHNAIINTLTSIHVDISCF